MLYPLAISFRMYIQARQLLIKVAPGKAEKISLKLYVACANKEYYAPWAKVENSLILPRGLNIAWILLPRGLNTAWILLRCMVLFARL